LNKIEARLKTQAKDSDKNEMVNLLVRMGKKDAESEFLVCFFGGVCVINVFVICRLFKRKKTFPAYVQRFA
jgi:1,4-dihydroxy-2-naphthoate octaprenyltransferase